MTCACEGANPQNLQKLVQCVEPTLFHRVDRPANLGDDTATPPEELPYKNVLLVYEANGHVYLYSSDGVPTFISYLPTDANVDALEAEIQQLLADLEQETADRIAATDELNERVDNLGNQEVVKSVDVSADNSTATITITTEALTGASGKTDNIPLPVASAEQAGVMNTATYSAVQENAENIDSILNGAVVVEDLPSAPTQDELTDAWVNATGKEAPINRASIYDITNEKVWYYYANIDGWKDMPAGKVDVEISTATNDTAGIVKGSTADGQVAVEADGTMSLNGYDMITHDLENLTELTDGRDTPAVARYTLGADFEGGLFNRYNYSENLFQILYRYRDTQIGEEFYDIFTIPIADTSHAGLMRGNDKVKLDNLPAITAIGKNLELTADGVLNATGGGGGGSIDLLSAYTDSPADDVAYNAPYINSRLDGISLAFGMLATAENNCIALGQIANAVDNAAVAIGQLTRAESWGTALGANARAGYWGSIALGVDSSTTRNYELFVGSRYQPNFVTNVKAGELPTDAVNLQQMQDYVAEHAGGLSDPVYTPEEIQLGDTSLTAARSNTDPAGGQAGVMSAFQATQLHALALAYEAEEKGTTLYSGTASTNNVELSEAATSYDHIIVVAEYMGEGSFALQQQVSATYYPNGNASAFQLNAYDVTTGNTPSVELVQDIWSLTEDGTELELASATKAMINSTTEVTPDTTSNFTITKVVGFGKQLA